MRPYDDEIPTYAEAKRRLKEHIALMREGDRGERRLAEVLAQCRKGNRCNLLDCPVWTDAKIFRNGRPRHLWLSRCMASSHPSPFYCEALRWTLSAAL